MAVNKDQTRGKSGWLSRLQIVFLCILLAVVVYDWFCHRCYRWSGVTYTWKFWESPNWKENLVNVGALWILTIVTMILVSKWKLRELRRKREERQKKKLGP